PTLFCSRNRRTRLVGGLVAIPASTTPALQRRVKRSKIGIALRKIAKRRIHFEANLQMHSGVFQVTEQNFVTTHVVIINWLLQQRGRATKQQFLGLTRPADLMQAKTGVQKSRAGLGGSAAKAAANSQGARPLFLAHQVMQAQLQDFRAMLVFILDRI